MPKTGSARWNSIASRSSPMTPCSPAADASEVVATAAGSHARLRRRSGNSPHAPAAARRHRMIASGASPAAMISGLLNPRTGRFHEENRKCEQHEVERRVQDDRRQEAEAQEDQRPDHRRHDQLHEARVRRQSRIVRVRAAEHERLDDEGDRDANPPVSEALADQRAKRSGIARNTHSSMKPACREIAMGESAGTRELRMFGSDRCSEGCHQPSHLLVA